MPILCRINLHKWRSIAGSEETYDKFYSKRAYFKCERCQKKSPVKWDVSA